MSKAASASFDLSGRVALVTGSARGLGRATALALAAAGSDLVLGVRNLASVHTLVEEITALGRRAFAIEMDVQDLDQCDLPIDTGTQHFGKIDILVNNAGGGIGARALDVQRQDFDWVFRQNVTSSFFIAQKFAKTLIKLELPGHIINISSQAGTVALPGEPAYCIAKAAVTHMTKCLALEWGEHGILVNAISPTFIETPGTAAALSDPEFKADTIERIAALRRIGIPQEVAGAVVFLASPAASLITGHNLAIDGGWTIR